MYIIVLPRPADCRRSPGQADPGTPSGAGARAITDSAAAPTATAEVALGPAGTLRTVRAAPALG